MCSANVCRISILSLLVLTLLVTVTRSQKYDLEKVRSVFVSNVLKTVGQSSEITIPDLQKYFANNNIHLNSGSLIDKCVKNGTDGQTVDEACLLGQCLDPSEVYELAGLSEGSGTTEVNALSTILLHLIADGHCTTRLDGNNTNTLTEEQLKHHPPSSVEAWGFGILCTTLINLCSLTGVVALPFIHGDMYKKVLIWMVGLAVGTLVGSSLLFLIPEALELTEQELNEHSYVWKCLVVVMAILVFFNIERVLKMLTEYREKKKNCVHRRRTTSATMDFSSFHVARPVSDYKNVDDLPHVSPCGKESQSSESLSLEDKDESIVGNGDIEKIEQNNKAIQEVPEEGKLIHHHKHRHHHHHGNRVEPVAWMIIFGDGIHNFIDGISIGAAFTESILAGVSVSVAILCEELPHELGDFAVLLNAGMRIKKAVLYNFLSACMCYIGLVVGIFLGENTSTHTWVFAFAGGMFLYISLVDMMPEMTAAADMEDNKLISPNLIFFLQNFGMVVGFAIMLLMAIYGGNLENAIKGGS